MITDFNKHCGAVWGLPGIISSTQGDLNDVTVSEQSRHDFHAFDILAKPYACV